MMLSERAEEVLEALWIEEVEMGKKQLELGASRDEPAIEELIKLGFIRRDADHIHLLEKGKSLALGCVRRHRLAERLMTDIFDLKGKTINELGCRFEHFLHEGLEDKVCVILGHPKVCPHGKAIPPGKCCQEKKIKSHLKFIAPLTDLDVKEKGRIAYLHTKDNSQMQKLMSIGILPGMTITLSQKFPSYCISLGQAQFAVDKELASAIYVRLTK